MKRIAASTGFAMIRLNDILFRRKIISLGVISVIITVILIVTSVIFIVRRYEGSAIEKVNELTTASMENTTRGIYHLVMVQQEAVQQEVGHNLNVARYMLNQAGKITPGKTPVRWTAINQVDQHTVEIDLPEWQIGGERIAPNPDPAVESPVVDEITRTVGGTAAIYQRMNEAGDMLCISTSALNADGKRAVGMFIPAVNPDGAPNPIIQKILLGEPYHAADDAVESGIAAAYEPILDEQNAVTGMLSVGIQQESSATLRSAVQQTKIGKTGHVYVINAKGDARGRYVIAPFDGAPDGAQDGASAWEMRDDLGGAPIQAMVGKALSLQPGEAGAVDYPSGGLNVRGQQRIMKTQVMYFEPWDWVIVSEAPQEELEEYVRTLKDGRNSLMRTSALVGLGILLLTGTALSLLTMTLTRPLDHLTSVAARIAKGDLTLKAHAQGKDEVGTLGRAFNEMTDRLRGLISDEKAQRQRLESTVQVYVDHMERVAQGDLQARVPLDGRGADTGAVEAEGTVYNQQDALHHLGEQLNMLTVSLQQSIDQLREASFDLSMSSSEILSTTVNQAAGAVEQSAAIEQTTITVEQLKSIAEHGLARAQQVADVAQKTVQTSERGRQAVQDTITGMGQVRDQVEDIAANILQLSEQTRQIGQIIATVNDIAEQSNLLAINASVEAARAGGAGLSFAVVAEEMRDMAKQSRAATEQVRNILVGIQNAIQATVAATEAGKAQVSSGVQLAAQTGEAIEMLSATIQQAAQATTELAAGGQQQSAGVDQIVQAMHNINTATQQSLASTHQAERSAHNLDDLAKKMAETVGRYRI